MKIIDRWFISGIIFQIALLSITPQIFRGFYLFNRTLTGFAIWNLIHIVFRIEKVRKFSREGQNIVFKDQLAIFLFPSVIFLFVIVISIDYMVANE